MIKGATIIFDINASEIVCTVRNQHDGGAELKVPVEAIIPDTFTLYIPVDAIAYEAIVRWRRGERLGVQFISKGPKPKLHYG